MSSNKDSQHFLTMDNLSPAVKNVQYAVRGKVVIRAGEIEKDLKNVLLLVFCCCLFSFIYYVFL